MARRRGRFLSARAYHLPGRSVRERPERFRGVTLAVPEVSAAEAGDLLRSLRDSRLEGLDRRERCRAIGEAAARFLDPADDRRRLAEDLLPGLTGFSGVMVREGLSRLFAALDTDSLQAVLGAAPADVHATVVIVSAGNLPGVALPKAALALAAGSSCLVKPGSGEPLLAALFAEALSEISPPLGAALAVLWWRGGARAIEAEVGRAADSLIVYGSDAAVEALRALAAGEFVGYGHRSSVGIVDLDGPDPEAAASAAALDVAMYDQLGCLSPQCLYAIGSAAARESFVDRLAVALERLAVAMPRGEVPEGSATAIRRLHDEIEWRDIGGEAVRRLSGRSGDWTVVVESRPTFRPSPLYRTVFVLPLERLSGLEEALGGARSRIECAGLWPFDGNEADELRQAASACGIPNVARLGDMQRPTLRWRQCGKPPLEGIRID